MESAYFKSSPFTIKISFHKVMEALEDIADNDVDYRSAYARALLKHTESIPELREGITDPGLLNAHEGLIRNLLADLFPTALSRNEIKAASVPFYNLTFNYTERFRAILKAAGRDFDMNIRNFDAHEFYIMNCCLILNSYYGFGFDFKRPLFYDIPDENGVMHHYRIVYNADFIEILPTGTAPEISQADVDLLIDNYHDLDLWKEKFPEGSWMMKGFGIMSLFDATNESAISNLKSNLLKTEDFNEMTNSNLEAIFRSIYKIADLRIGYTEINSEESMFRPAPFKDIRSHILSSRREVSCSSMLCGESLEKLLDRKDYYILSDVAKTAASPASDTRFAEHLLKQDVGSCILAPVVKHGRLLGFIELVSARPRELNSINAKKLDYILPFLTDSIERFYSELQNEIDAIIQKEYTAIHPSVYWKFREEALLHINHRRGRSLPYKEIKFKEVYPLYGQIDVKGSSVARNETLEKDLILQITELLGLFRFIFNKGGLPVIEQHIFELEKLESELKSALKADTEAVIQSYIINEVHPVLKHFDSSDAEVHTRIGSYFEKLDSKLKMVYDSRKDFDDTLSIINKQMAEVLDRKQAEAQSFFPHYYERFKTDGVEHNLYIGGSIAPKLSFSTLYLENLRLWQLQAMIEMENEYYRLRPSLPYELDVTSLILVFSTPIAIRFRMDEKRFDVDGTYNARYEVVKKRLDKANIKGTSERITKKGFLTIIYSQRKEEAEYKRYIKFLQHRKMLGNTVELFEVEDLQGVSGLRGIRVDIVYSVSSTGYYSYEDLMRELEHR